LKAQEVEQKITNRIAGLEEQENQLQEWLDCIRRVSEIAERMGCTRPKNQVPEGSLMRAFEELVDRAELEKTEPGKGASGSILHGGEPVQSPEGSKYQTQVNEELNSLEISETIPKAGEESSGRREVPDETNLVRLRSELAGHQLKHPPIKKRLTSFMSSLLSSGED